MHNILYITLDVILYVTLDAFKFDPESDEFIGTVNLSFINPKAFDSLLKEGDNSVGQISIY